MDNYFRDVPDRTEVARARHTGRVNWLVVGIALIAAFSAFSQMITGFGFALVGLPLLALLTDPATAVVAMTALSTLLTLGATVHQRRLVDWRTAGSVTAMAVLGLPIGLVALRFVDSRWLSVLIGIVVLVFTIALARGAAVRGRGFTPAAGFLSGALLTSTGMNGPPLVVAFQNKGMTPGQFRATLQATFTLQDMFALVGFAVAGLFGQPVWSVVAIGTPAMLIGWWLGNHAARRINPSRFRQLVLVMLAASGIVSIATGVLG